MSNTVPARTAATSSRSSYLDILNDAWAQHLAPRAVDAPTVISTFAGCGGSSLGYSMAGFRELLAVEWDQNAVDTFRLNFPDVPVYHGDIAKLSVDECLARTGLQPGDLDVFDGSPPCQGFSTAGKRMIDDPRNQLFREYVRLLRGLRPKVFVMENVSGMVKGKMKLIFAEILRELKASGYAVSARLMNAMYFNVPQSRERMIFIGVREDLGVVPTHPRGNVRPFVTRDALNGLGDNLTDRVNLARESKTAQQMSVVRPGARCRLHHSHHRLAWASTAPTIDRGGGAGAYHIWHPSEHRPIRVAEVKRIASFPDDYLFAGAVSDAFTRIGNSVPPLFMRSIAQHIREHILSR